MSDWHTVACLLVLRDEFNEVSPRRDKSADGTIGDTAHQKTGTSDHLPDEDTPALRGKDPDKVNEVHALDVDSTGPWPGGPAWFDAAVERVLEQQRRDGDNCRLEYIIWNRRIASRTKGWVWRAYTGTADPHTGHAHFSARYLSATETDTRPWGVNQEDDMLSIDDVRKAVAEELAKRLDKVQKYDAANKPVTGTSAYMGSAYALGVISRDAGNAARGVDAVTKAVAALASKVDTVAATVTTSDLSVRDAVLAELTESTKQLQAAIAGIPEELLDALRAGDPEQTAAALRAVLGEQAPTVGRILAGAA